LAASSHLHVNQHHVIQLSCIPTADQINSTVPITQIPWPSSTSQALHDLFPTEFTRVWSSNDRIAVELIRY